MVLADIWTWKPLNSFADNRSTLESDLHSLVKAGACQRVYYGPVEEDRKTVYLVIVWESLSHREALSTGLQHLRDIISTTNNPGSELKSSLVQFNNEVNNALDAPKTEITLLTLKKGVVAEDLQRVLDSVTSNHHVANSKYAPMAWGPIQGNPEQDRFYLLFGWESAQAHRETVADPSFSSFVVDLLNAVDFESCHGEFSRFQQDFLDTSGR